MARLSDLKTNDLVKLLLIGPPGSGKTVMAAGFPGPILYFDFDNKVSSAARFYRADKERLDQIEVVNLSASLSENPINELLRQIEKLSAMQKKGEYLYKTLVVDSITTFSSSCLAHIVKTNPGIKRVPTAQGIQPGLQDYGILKREFTRLIPGLINLSINVVMLGHVSVDKDENTGELLHGVQMDGAFSQQLPIYFDEVWHASRNDKGEYLAQTQSSTKFKCRSQIPGLPNPVKLSYEEVKKYL